ncbi:MAG TPA: decaprenyl-phosphate phosphoribosyltransferase [Rhodocyclaceae bacterium]|nr:decaprenyl-phosphate phosphoribosyltransferase [Rhodocyclaceae bacterium]
MSTNKYAQGAAEHAAPQHRLPAWLRLLRPHQWLKNGFVLIGLLFAHAWDQPNLVLKAIAATTAFCLLSSAVYVFNDLIDREQDRLHPQKRYRPLASGTIGAPAALALLVVCLIFACDIVVRVVGHAYWVFLAYLCVNVAYTLKLKHVVILDAFLIAAGFMLRLFAGTVAIGIPPSQWLIICGLMLTLFLGFAKRRAELNAMYTDAGAHMHRRVLEHYSPALLDQFITITVACTVLSYSLYTVSDNTIALHGRHLWITMPFVLYGMFRYLYLLHRRGGGGDAAEAFFTDRHLQVTVLGWLTCIVALLEGAV